MAKLKARGRQEIARMTRERETPDDRLTTSEKEQVALMSDGNVLWRRTIRWRDPSYGAPTHDYGWKVKGKIKAGLTPEDFVRIYQERDYALESHSPSYLVRRGNTIENLSAKLAAWERLRYFLDMSFQYLLPVKIIESPSMDAAEHDVGHVWWVDGRRKGPPADPRQERFADFG